MKRLVPDYMHHSFFLRFSFSLWYYSFFPNFSLQCHFFLLVCFIYLLLPPITFLPSLFSFFVVDFYLLQWALCFGLSWFCYGLFVYNLLSSLYYFCFLYFGATEGAPTVRSMLFCCVGETLAYSILCLFLFFLLTRCLPGL